MTTDIPYATVIKASWRIAEMQGLDGLTPEIIAAEASTDAQRLRQIFPTRSHILLSLMHDVFENLAATVVGEHPRDNLFDLIMAHFDGLQNHRPAVVRLYNDITTLRHLDLLVRLRKPYWQQASAVLTTAGVPTDDLLGFGKVSMVALLGLWLLTVWVSDESDDLAKTMAALDQGLHRLGDINNMVSGLGC
ncbi:MAG: hypothetical protein WCG04_06065 [Alphaproteobacteria bacterium]